MILISKLRQNNNHVQPQNCPQEDAEQYVRDFFGGFPQLTEWIGRAHACAREKGFIDQPTGRRRRFLLRTQKFAEEIDKQSVNTPIQGFASDINTEAICRLQDSMPEAGLGYPLFPVHDAIEAEVVSDHLHEGVSLIRDTMEHIVNDPDVAFPVEVKVGPSWGSTEKYLFNRES